MFLVGLFIHIIFLFSIFDIYFKSPIVKNVAPYQPTHVAPVDRLVLFIVDGLRAESFVNYTTMPYLRSIANSHGRWGISRTRVPTESRPGHVAIIAGFYEDPSAVAKGWKENPVDFDSIFNQSSYTWCWGTYDILEIFTKENVKHIYTDKLDPYDQAFSTDKDVTLLDDWVFTKVKDFFSKASQNLNLYEKLKSKKIVFFLHLLGTDTSGHTHKPKTHNFLTTVKFADENIQEVEKLIRDFYNDDGRTAFLMTSDHGMTDWGSHGTGDNHETETPYVLWGAGVHQIESKDKQLDPATKSMSLENRFDINQADLTPLMSTLLSIPVPTNSIGQLPTALLNMTLENKAKAIYSNSRQMLSQYNKKRMDVEANAISMLYQPYEPLDGNKVDEIISFTEKLIKDKQYEKLILLSEEIIQLSLNGLNYYHNYYQRPLLIAVTLSFMGWILYLLRVLLKQKLFTKAEYDGDQNCMLNTVDSFIHHVCVLISINLGYIIYAQNLPVQYYIYFLLPICLWSYALTPISLWLQVMEMLIKEKNIFWLILEILSYIMGSICLAVALTHRWALSIPLFGMGLWPFLSFSRHHFSNKMCVVWVVTCFLLSIFSFLPVVGKDVFISLVVIAGLLWMALVYSYFVFIYVPNDPHTVQTRIEVFMGAIQSVIMYLALQNIVLLSKMFETGGSIPKFSQVINWFMSVSVFPIPLLFTRKFLHRLIGINTSLIIFYLLLSVSHEGFFMVTLICNVNYWLYMEFELLNQKQPQLFDWSFETNQEREATRGLRNFERCINSHDFRRAFFFTTYIIVSYFGTGNIASLNSFEVRWVLCFTTSFQPFIMTTLILLKTLSPFLSVACTFRAVQQLTMAPMDCLHIIVLIFSNIMGLYMLYHVKNTGSWLDIGTSISQFVIVQVITLFIVIINQIAKLLTETDLQHYVVKKLLRFSNRMNV